MSKIIRSDPVRIVGTEPVQVQLVGAEDPFAGEEVLTVIDYPHHEIHEGNMFMVSFISAHASPVADDSSILIALTTTTKYLHATFQGEPGGDAELLVYENPTIVGGGALTCFNMFRTSIKVSTVTAVSNPTVNAYGVNIFGTFIPGGTGPTSVGSQSSLRPGSEWIFGKNSIYLIRLLNRAGSVQQMGLNAQWYEES